MNLQMVSQLATNLMVRVLRIRDWNQDLSPLAWNMMQTSRNFKGFYLMDLFLIDFLVMDWFLGYAYIFPNLRPEKSFQVTKIQRFAADAPGDKNTADGELTSPEDSDCDAW